MLLAPSLRRSRISDRESVVRTVTERHTAQVEIAHLGPHMYIFDRLSQQLCLSPGGDGGGGPHRMWILDQSLILLQENPQMQDTWAKKAARCSASISTRFKDVNESSDIRCGRRVDALGFAQRVSAATEGACSPGLGGDV